MNLNLYFANRQYHILDVASTDMQTGLKITDDKLTEDIETGVTTFEAEISYSSEMHRAARRHIAAGNYIFRCEGQTSTMYTIIEREDNIAKKTLSIYCEDAGMDLLNETVDAYTATSAETAESYINRFSVDTGFVVAINEIADLKRTLSWEGSSTVAERLRSVATQFGAELSYSFAIDRFLIVGKYINLWKKRGRDTYINLRFGREISDITEKVSVANLATALAVTGGTPEGSDTPITLSGYDYDDGDIYVYGTDLFSRSALKKWSRYATESGSNFGHIRQLYSYDTTSQSELCSHAVSKLRSIMEPERTIDVEFNELPETVGIGDSVRITEPEAGLYITARILKLETSVCNNKRNATLGDYTVLEDQND